MNVNELKWTRNHNKNLQQNEIGTDSRVLGHRWIGGDEEIERVVAVNVVVDVLHHLMIITITVQTGTREYLFEELYLKILFLACLIVCI
jgi:hypothetical protein